jgi:hypothetical protein
VTDRIRGDVAAPDGVLEELAVIADRVAAVRDQLARQRDHPAATPGAWTWTDTDGNLIALYRCEDDDLNPGCIHIATSGTVCITPAILPELTRRLRGEHAS